MLPRLFAYVASWEIANSVIGSSRRKESKNITQEAKVIQATCQLNPERDKSLSYSGLQSPNSNLSHMNIAQQFRFEEQDYLTLDLNYLQNRLVANPSILNSRFSGISTFQRQVPSALDAYKQVVGDLIWQNLGVLKGNSAAIFSSHSLDQLCQTIFVDGGELQLLGKIFGIPQIRNVNPLRFSEILRLSTPSQ